MLPKGYRLALSVRGTDYVFPGEPGAGVETLGKVWTGVGPFTHNDPRARPPAVFGGDVTLHRSPRRDDRQEDVGAAPGAGVDYGVDLQKRFFGYFLKGEKNGWNRQSRVQLNVRHPGERFVIRHEDDWPISRTRWTKFHLASGAHTLTTEPPTGSATVTFDALGDGVTFLTEPMPEATEITGPVAAKLNISSSTVDADIFLVLRLFAPDMKEVVFQGALDPQYPDWARLAARLASQARQKANLAVPPLSHPR